MILRNIIDASLVPLKTSDTGEEALSVMTDYQLNHLPIVNKEGGIMGLVTAHALISHVAAHFPRTVYNQPPNPNQTSSSVEGA